jgi:F-type H+-transporting ATPase subunit b
MPQLNPEFFATQIFWLVITFVFLYLLLSTIALPRIAAVLEVRQRRIDDNLLKAAVLKAEADVIIKAYEQVLAESRAKALLHIQETINGLREEAVEHNKDLDLRLSEKIKASEVRIAEAKAHALADVREIAMEVADATVTRLIGIKTAQADLDGAVAEVLKGNAQ